MMVNYVNSTCIYIYMLYMLGLYVDWLFVKAGDDWEVENERNRDR